MVDTSKAQGRLSERRRLDEMSWPQIKAGLDAGHRTVIAAAGSMEQHGPHLPLQTDTLLGTFLVEAIVERLPNTFQGPTIPFGVSGHHMPFAGTITMPEELFKATVREYVASLAAHGFDQVVIIPSHGGNFEPLRQLENETAGSISGARFLTYSDLNTFIETLYGVAERDEITPAVCGAHAGEAETSLVLAAREDLVEMDYAEEGFVGDFDQAAQLAVFEKGIVALTDNGILGDARPASPERGEVYRDALADMLAEWIQERLP